MNAPFNALVLRQALNWGGIKKRVTANNFLNFKGALMKKLIDV